MRIFDDTVGYWVWSSQGEADDGINYGRTFVKGMIPYPVPGDIAQEMESFAYVTEKYVPGTWFAGWEKETTGDRSRPIFRPIADNGPGLPSLNAVSELPAKLPKEYLNLFGQYTASGKIRKVVDGN